MVLCLLMRLHLNTLRYRINLLYNIPITYEIATAQNNLQKFFHDSCHIGILQGKTSVDYEPVYSDAQAR
jgi:hypothetical protein